MKSAQSYFTVKTDYVSTLSLTNEETKFPAKVFSQFFCKKIVAEGISVYYTQKAEGINFKKESKDIIFF